MDFAAAFTALILGGAVILVFAGLFRKSSSAKKTLNQSWRQQNPPAKVNLNRVPENRAQPVNFKKNQPPKPRDYSEGPRL